MKKLFQYAVLWHPNKQQQEDGQSSEVIVEVKTVLATDEKAAALMAARDIPDSYDEELDQVQVAIRPF